MAGSEDLSSKRHKIMPKKSNKWFEHGKMGQMCQIFAYNISMIAMEYEIGIDETARCPSLGPLYILGLMAPKARLKQMRKQLVVRDSKITTPAQRERAFNYVINDPDFTIRLIEIQPQLIDMAITRQIRYNLNDLEAVFFAKIILLMLSKRNAAVYVNNFEKKRSQLIERWKRVGYWEPLKNAEIHITHKYNVAVGLASMVCKYIEDAETWLWKNIVYGFDFGSKNPNDAKTQEFVRKHPNSQLIRRNWGTIVPRILSEKSD